MAKCFFAITLLFLLTACSTDQSQAIPTYIYQTQEAATQQISTLPTRTGERLSPSSSPTPIAITRLFELGKGRLQAIAWAPDGSLLAVASASGVTLYDGSSLDETISITTPVQVRSLAFSPDLRWLALGQSDGDIRLWNLAHGAFEQRLEGEDASVNALAFNPDGSRLAIGRIDGTLWLWDLIGGSVNRQPQVHRGWINCLAFSPDGQTLASASRDGSVILWSSTAERLATLTAHEGSINAVTFRRTPFINQMSLMVTASSDTSLRFWDWQNGQVVLTLPSQTQPLLSLAFDTQEQLLVSGDEAGFIQLWNGQTGEPIAAFQAHQAAVIGLSFRPGSSWLASASEDGTLKLWDTSGIAAKVAWDQKLLLNPQRTIASYSPPVSNIALSPTGEWLASAHNDGNLRLWRLTVIPEQPTQTGALHAILTAHRGAATSLAFDDTGHWLVSGGKDGSLRLWDLRDILQKGDSNSERPSPRALLGHSNVVWDVAFSPDGNTIASASADGTINLWSRKSGEILYTFHGSNAAWLNTIAFSPDGRLLAAGDAEGTIYLWDVSSRVTQQTISGHIGAVLDLAFSPDGSLLFSSGNDRSLRVWETISGRLYASLDQLPGRVTRLAISPFDDFLAAGSAEGLVSLWMSNPRGEWGTLQPYISFQALPITGLAFESVSPSQTQRWLISASSDGRIEVWGIPLEEK